MTTLEGLEQSVTFRPFVRIAVILAHIAEGASYHQVANIISRYIRSCDSANWEGMIDVVISPFHALGAIIAFALLPLILCLDLLYSMSAKNRVLLRSTIGIFSLAASWVRLAIDTPLVGSFFAVADAILPASLILFLCIGIVAFSSAFVDLLTVISAKYRSTSIHGLAAFWRLTSCCCTFTLAIFTFRCKPITSYVLRLFMEEIGSCRVFTFTGAASEFARIVIRGYNIHDRSYLSVRPRLLQVARGVFMFPLLYHKTALEASLWQL